MSDNLTKKAENLPQLGCLTPSINCEKWMRMTELCLGPHLEPIIILRSIKYTSL